MSDQIFDAFQFCRHGEFREGNVAIADMPRLAGELAGGKDGVLHWSAKGGMDSFHRFRLEVALTGPVQLQCQRCMGAMPFDMGSRSVLILAKDEDEAEELDQLLEKEDVEIVVGSTSMDLLAILEDEALLALPLAPRHEVCPSAAAVHDNGKTAAPSPFSVLRNLKSE